jgi:hypothetical protein
MEFAMKQFRSSFGLAALCLVVYYQAFAQVPVRTIAYTGQPAPGTGVTFDLFFPPTISPRPFFSTTSHVMFTGRLFGSGVDQTNQYGIWMYEPIGGLALVARKGNQAPGFSAGTRFEHLGFETALVGPQDNVVGGFRTVFFATLSGSAFPPGTRSVWVYRIGDTARVVAYTGGFQGSYTLGAVFRPVRHNDNAPAATSITLSSQIYTTTFSIDSIALWTSPQIPDSTGHLRLVFHSRNQVPGLSPGLLFGFPQTHMVCDNGTVVFRAGVFISSGAQFGNGIWRKPFLSQIEPVLVALNGVPVILPGLNAGESISQFEYVLSNAGGSVAFTALISGTPGGYGFWSQDTGSWRLVMRSGMQVPGLPAGVTFQSLREFSNSPTCIFYTDLDEPIFLAKLQGTGITTANDMSVWRYRTEQLQLLAREGDQMAGAAAGVVFDRIERIAANRFGEIIVETTIRGPGITTSNNQGIWARNPLGQYLPVVQKGNRVEVQPGVMRTVNSVTLAVGDPDSYSTGTDGRSTVFNYTREVAFYASFLDNAVTVNAVCAADARSIFTDVEESSLPFAFSLHQNFPNPFNPSTKIKFTIPSVETRHSVSLRVYDVLGREVATLVNENLQPGSYKVTFDATGLASGVYFYRLQAGEFTQTNRMMLMR